MAARRHPQVPQGTSKDGAFMTTNSAKDVNTTDLPSREVIEEATRFRVNLAKSLNENYGRPGRGTRDGPWQHHKGPPTAPGPNYSATYPQYDVTSSNFGNHKSMGHFLNVMIFLIPTILHWNDPTRQQLVKLFAFCAAEALVEQFFHNVTNQMHFVHAWKQIPLLGAGALAVYHGAWGAAQAGPRDLLWVTWWFWLTIFLVQAIFVEGFVTHFGKFWPIKAPQSV